MSVGESSSVAMPDLSRRLALITGGGRGIGATLARGFAEAGAEVVICGRHEEVLAATALSIASSGHTCRYVIADVSVGSEVQELMKITAGPNGVIDILVNNAGIAGPTKPVELLTDLEWTETLMTDLTGPFLCCREAIPYLRASSQARIINIGSASGKRPLVNRAPYCAAKLGLVGLTRTLALELGSDNVSVNVISPYLTAGTRLEEVTASMGRALGLSSDDMLARMVDETAFKRPTTPEDVLHLALFLASSAARNLTGQDFNVSAGAVMY